MRSWTAPLGALLALSALPAAAQVRVDERVEVARVLVDVRVTDSRGVPIRGLELTDFRVKVDGKRARVEWVEWVGEPAAVEAAHRPAVGRPIPGHPGGPSGRLVVFLFQKDLMPSRVEGMIRMMRDSARFVDRLQPDDRAAVLVYDSRLHLWLDFTADRDLLRRTLGRGILFEPPSQSEGGPVSLRAALAARPPSDAYSPEDALRVIGETLRPFEGAKSLVMFGYGFGDFRPGFGDPLAGRAVLDRRYERAREALVAARVSVFALDITQANAHTLEGGLMTVAEETGGFYASTFEFPALAFERLDGALAGYYVLSVEAPSGRSGRHRIDVDVRARGATVLARQYYVD